MQPEIPRTQGLICGDTGCRISRIAALFMDRNRILRKTATGCDSAETEHTARDEIDGYRILA
jgi:hypothetical protein